MSDQQGTSKAARGLLIIKITHVKLETATRARATLVTQSNLARQIRRGNDEARMTNDELNPNALLIRFFLASSFHANFFT
jgi:hypothetical protein